jgi:Flp pilus assembly protein TadG
VETFATCFLVAGFEGRLLTRARQYLRKLGERGVTSVEFAIVGALFLLLLLAVFELGYMVFVQSVLDSSARTAARQIRTGQAQGTGNAQTDFQTVLCAEVSSIVGCNNLIYAVQSFGSSWSATQTAVNAPLVRDPITHKLVIPPFSSGTCGDIIAVQVMYDYQFFTMWVGQLLGNSSQSTLLMSTVVFQNEPFCGG